MTANEFREALGRLELTQRGAAVWYGVGLSTIRQWLHQGPSPPAAKLTRLTIRFGLTAREADSRLA